jgi:uncharacterized membrane protein YhfC
MEFLTIPFALNALLMIFIPIGLGIVLTRRFNLGWRLFWIGAATFIISQIGHIPFNLLLTRLFQQGILPIPPEKWILPFNALVLGLSAGLWEELSRWGVYRWWAKDARSWRKGILMGAGHGGIESLLLGLLALWVLVQMLVIRSTGLPESLPAEQMQLAMQQVQAYWSTPVYLSLLGALERIFAITIQISLSVLVLQAFLRKQSRWLWYAIAWHTLVDAVSVYALGTWGAVVTEVIVAVLALISLGFIFWLRKPEPEEVKLSIDNKPVPTAEDIQPISPTVIDEENLEKTRYQN